MYADRGGQVEVMIVEEDRIWKVEVVDTQHDSREMQFDGIFERLGAGNEKKRVKDAHVWPHAACLSLQQQCIQMMKTMGNLQRDRRKYHILWPCHRERKSPHSRRLTERMEEEERKGVWDRREFKSRPEKLACSFVCQWGCGFIHRNTTVNVIMEKKKTWDPEEESNSVSCWITFVGEI